MSSRAVTPELLRMMWTFNHLAENVEIKDYEPGSHDPDKWGGGRTRRALWALYLLAFWCLLRFDEVLKIQIQDIEVVSETCIKLTLPYRKTHQFGGGFTILLPLTE